MIRNRFTQEEIKWGSSTIVDAKYTVIKNVSRKI